MTIGDTLKSFLSTATGGLFYGGTDGGSFTHPGVLFMVGLIVGLIVGIILMFILGNLGTKTFRNPRSCRCDKLQQVRMTEFEFPVTEQEVYDADRASIEAGYTPYHYSYWGDRMGFANPKDEEREESVVKPYFKPHKFMQRKTSEEEIANLAYE